MYLDIKSVFALATTCRGLSNLATNELVFRRLVERDYGINYIDNEHQTWRAFYKDLYTKAAAPCCRQLSLIPSPPSETKRVIYTAATKGPLPMRCDRCRTEIAAYLNLDTTSDRTTCRACTKKEDGVQLEISSGDLYCFDCDRKLGTDDTNKHEQSKANSISSEFKATDQEDETTSLDRRRRAEHQLYVQELRREDMSLKHYLVEKQWGRTWMLFRTREGSPLPGRITNNKLARNNGSLDPSIRLPMDKYRPSPETHADIVSEKLWIYLEKVYGVQGKAFSEDDLQFPEYARLRAYIDDYKNSILNYP
ncbi:hypothetical protein BCR43DRAFT_511400 [Syncephalastrum racemosum]|uniref:DUSP domain-containing protein n=1 Tax=Syncephalastrum racemosum TaxID=13706 RepID=A0A1X2HM34_SYNRA|nr:hypothetical protein BCR43DRAFT_511400 [Syncephalastrum racemosum]